VLIKVLYYLRRHTQANGYQADGQMPDCSFDPPANQA